ncbi:radical SAM protein [Desulfovibrio sulfodismutans]|uniref:Radical SAM protein n=1 Tax=Desulfolutivibrio sulfodismutans TaxID=63561 RepID=A0A7K3NLQ5_9BACT|nr:radical SAM protein [Desulfolutivibrio sulfodismutans]NDY56119.1 radical SAM protein [Desulfolutivibrio sulfodismutans]QLA13172.1 radical SAM protein [Desulfolutivibrio sulfodismutans DSM 3696]
MERKFIQSVKELPQGAQIVIYGAGGRGGHVLRSARRSKHVTVQAFLDTFKSGEFCGLPVYKVDEYWDSELAKSKPLIVIASVYHRVIASDLESADLDRVWLFIEKQEVFPLAELPPGSVVKYLNQHKILLEATRRKVKSTKGKKCWCPLLMGVYFRPTGLSLCCWMPDLVEVTKGPEESLERLDAIRKHIIAGIADGSNKFCASCPDLQWNSGKPTTKKYDWLNIDYSVKCNMNCSYCIVKHEFKACLYNARAIVEHILDNDYLEPKFNYCWGGNGEPTLNPDFGHLMERLLPRDSEGRVYTNATLYSEHIASALRRNKMEIVVSVDAGTAKTFKAIRGRDRFKSIWANIARYLKDNANRVIVKYIVTPKNLSEAEMRAFVDKCVETGVHNVLVSRDFYKKCTCEEADAVRWLSEECAEVGIHVGHVGTAVPDEKA